MPEYNLGKQSARRMDTQQISIKPFEGEDQEAVQSLILAGLAEHWGEID